MKKQTKFIARFTSNNKKDGSAVLDYVITKENTTIPLKTNKINNILVNYYSGNSKFKKGTHYVVTINLSDGQFIELEYTNLSDLKGDGTFYKKIKELGFKEKKSNIDFNYDDPDDFDNDFDSDLDDNFNSRNLDYETLMKLYNENIIDTRSKDIIDLTLNDHNFLITISLIYKNNTALDFLRSEGSAISTKNNGYIYSLSRYMEDVNDFLKIIYDNYDTINFMKFKKGEYITFERAEKIDEAYESNGEEAYAENKREITIKIENLE